MSEIKLTMGAEPATPPTGKTSIYADLATGLLRYKKDNGNSYDLVGQNDPELKSITIESPTSAEDISFFFTEDAITIYKMMAVVVGTTPSITWTIRHDPDRSAVGNEVVTGGTTTTNVTSGDTVTVFDDPSIPLNSFIWLETTAKTGTVNSLMITVYYTED